MKRNFEISTTMVDKNTLNLDYYVEQRKIKKHVETNVKKTLVNALKKGNLKINSYHFNPDQSINSLYSNDGPDDGLVIFSGERASTYHGTRTNINTRDNFKPLSFSGINVKKQE